MSESAAYRIEDEFHASPACDLTRSLLEVLRPIVDQMIDAERPQLLVLAGGRRSDDRGPQMLGDLGCSDANAAASGMNEHGLARLQSAHHDDQLPRGQVVHRDRRALLSGHVGRAREHLGLRRANHICVAAEMGRREHVAPNPARVKASASRINASGDFIAWDDRNAWKVRIESEAAHDVGEIDAACLHPNAQLACGRMRVRRLLDEKNLGRASFRNPDLPHAWSSSEIKGSLRVGELTRYLPSDVHDKVCAASADPGWRQFNALAIWVSGHI